MICLRFCSAKSCSLVQDLQREKKEIKIAHLRFRTDSRYDVNKNSNNKKGALNMEVTYHKGGREYYPRI